MQLYNSKLGGGGHMLNPFGIMNDGMVELMFYQHTEEMKQKNAIWQSCKTLSYLLQGAGTMLYDPHF